MEKGSTKYKEVKAVKEKHEKALLRLNGCHVIEDASSNFFATQRLDNIRIDIQIFSRRYEQIGGLHKCYDEFLRLDSNNLDAFGEQRECHA